MSYTKPTWVNDGAPAINAAALQSISDTLDVSQTMKFQATLTAAGWSGSDAPYTQTLQIPGIRLDQTYNWGTMGLTKSQYVAASAAGLQVLDYLAGSVTFQALYSKPNVDIPIYIQR